jgi:uncharacterized Fe-S cluster-containing radical SAM superfamily protein
MNLVFIDSSAAEVIVWHLDIENSKVLDRLRIKGSPKLAVERIKASITKYDPDKIVLDKTGIGIGYYLSILKWFKKLKNSEE